MSEGETSRNPPHPPQQGFQAAVNHMLVSKIDSLLWLTRLGTIIFTIFSMIPLFGINPYTSYQRALMSSAATSALRLHQRMPRIQFTREFGALLLMEDSCHYLLYSILFIISSPITLSLLPVFLFALLHSVHYSVVILNFSLVLINYHWQILTILGGILIIIALRSYPTSKDELRSRVGTKLGQLNLATSLAGAAATHQRNILKLVAFTEVCLMPITVIWLLSGKGSLLAPFAYYRFLTFRYASRRNPYTRNVFHEMRVVLQAFANTPGRNLTLKNMSYKIINYTSYLAPPIPAQQ